MQSGIQITKSADALMFQLANRTKLPSGVDEYAVIQNEVEALLENGVDFDELRFITGESIVHIFVIQGKLKTLEGLVGAFKATGKPLNLKAPDSLYGYKPLHFACSSVATSEVFAIEISARKKLIWLLI